MFANDTLLLGQATIQDASMFKQILDHYEQWSGQLISVQKSAIQFSPNVRLGYQGSNLSTVGYAGNCFTWSIARTTNYTWLLEGFLRLYRR
ncbi:hypothetical protein LIER_02774 [Lithospermum erythrorhizon]|uniref:Reverse transcriptase domain-containing protein n=1 Tax=Lithospermum erythrorhizon TaxID=34254 RepID=A0AAV3NVB6_LITER